MYVFTSDKQHHAQTHTHTHPHTNTERERDTTRMYKISSSGFGSPLNHFLNNAEGIRNTQNIPNTILMHLTHTLQTHQSSICQIAQPRKGSPVRSCTRHLYLGGVVLCTRPFGQSTKASRWWQLLFQRHADQAKGAPKPLQKKRNHVNFKKKLFTFFPLYIAL